MAGLRSTPIGVLAASLLLSACGGDGPSDGSAPAGSTGSTGPSGSSAADPVADAEAAVRSFYDDFAGGDLDEACRWWTVDYTESSVAEWNEGGYGPRVDSCPDLLRAISDVFAIVGEPADLLQVTEVDGALVDGTTARVGVMLASDDEGRETYLLTLTDDGWRISGDEAAATSSTGPPPG